MSQTYLTVAGHVASDPVMRTTGKGTTVVSFRLAQNHRRLDRATGEITSGPTSWYSVTAWRWLGQHVHDSIRKGDPVVVHGRLTVQESVDAGTGAYRTWVDLTAQHIGHDLSYGRTVFEKAERPVAEVDPEAAVARSLQLEQLEAAVDEAGQRLGLAPAGAAVSGPAAGGQGPAGGEEAGELPEEDEPAASDDDENEDEDEDDEQGHHGRQAGLEAVPA